MAQQSAHPILHRIPACGEPRQWPYFHVTDHRISECTESLSLKVVQNADKLYVTLFNNKKKYVWVAINKSDQREYQCSKFIKI